VPKTARAYHHGDLRRALLEESVVAIGEVGPAAISLRDLARRAGVSHAAPAHHFGDKEGLLTAVAAEGYRRLAASLREAWDETGSFLEVGVAYVEFAVANRPYFDVMFRPELYDDDDPDLREAERGSAAMLYGPIGEAGGRPNRVTQEAGVAAWSIVHGFATLWLNGSLPRSLGEDPANVARRVLTYLRPPKPRRKRGRIKDRS
jgi:AcrR family transcriptional regulator